MPDGGGGGGLGIQNNKSYLCDFNNNLLCISFSDGRCPLVRNSFCKIAYYIDINLYVSLFCPPYQTEASSISRDSYTGLWSVEFNRDSKDSVKKQTVKSRLVFLAAGIAGSTKILYQSREKGLGVSEKLGQHVSFHGIANGLCKNLADAVQGLDLCNGESGKSTRSNLEVF